MTVVIDGTTGITTPGLTDTGASVITVTDNTNAALRVTQLGTGNAVLVEDSTNPDSTPFVIDANGNTVVGYTSATTTVTGQGTVTPKLQAHGTTDSTATVGQYGWSNTIPYYVFNRSAGAIGTYTAPTATTPIGIVSFDCADGTSFVTAAEIRGSSDSAISTGIVPGRLTFHTTDTGGSFSERMRVTSTGVGIGVATSAYPLSVSDGIEVMYIQPSSSVTNIAAVNTPLAFFAANLEAMRISTGLNLGIGLTSLTDVGSLEIRAGTTAVAPILLNAGTNLTTPYAGAIEFDGNVFYATSDTTSGRGFVPTRQYFRRTTDATAFGPAIANFFGTTSGVSLDTSTFYEVEYNLYFTKTTAGTVTFTLTFSNAPINCDANYVGTPVGGVGTVGTSQTAALVKSTAAASALPATGSLTTAVNHQYTVRAIFQANATTGGTLNLQITSSAGTVTPLTGSYYKITRLPAANTGAFV